MKKLLVVILVLFSTMTAGFLWWLNEDMEKQLNSPLNLAEDSVLKIKPGQSLKSLANSLVKKNWLPHPYYFVYMGRKHGKASLLKIGEYDVAIGTTPLRLLDILVAGKVRQYSLTIPEGWSFKQIFQAVTENQYLKKTLNSMNPETVMTELGYAGHFAEGRIFPDTYLFPAGSSDKDFLRRAIQMQEGILQKEWENRDSNLPYRSSYEALIMASIIEKETGVVEERRQIAGVFVRRLRLKMKLQTDPTVIYAMADSFDGNIRRKDLSIDSPYNTYRYRGLPPTPIASPGREAIYAALHPEAGTSLYFVAKGDGSHYFSDNLKQHNRAVAKYQLKKH
jgi:UPF0755 protein